MASPDFLSAALSGLRISENVDSVGKYTSKIKLGLTSNKDMKVLISRQWIALFMEFYNNNIHKELFRNYHILATRFYGGKKNVQTENTNNGVFHLIKKECNNYAFWESFYNDLLSEELAKYYTEYGLKDNKSIQDNYKKQYEKYKLVCAAKTVKWKEKHPNAKKEYKIDWQDLLREKFENNDKEDDALVKSVVHTLSEKVNHKYIPIYCKKRELLEQPLFVLD
jgi:hypothetical protein